MEKNSLFEPIAIVGMSCRFPGMSDINEFWNFLVSKKTNVGELPDERINIEKWYDPDINAHGKTNLNKGALFSRIHEFDPFFFNISPKEAIEMHPSQKLMLELAWECVEYSNITYNKVEGSKSGVYIGNIWGDFEHFRKERSAEINSFSAIGQSANIIASRISYFMGLRGPSLVMDTGCSSSLVAIAHAVQSLHERNTNMCFAGGINHILNPEQYVYLSKFGGLSSSGKCSSFDAEADGFVRAEGAGLILLKRLSDAIKDNNKIFGVIKGIAMNNNGFNENLPATSVSGQLELLSEAYNGAGIEPDNVRYIEAHGTGTRIGDPIEAKALGKFFNSNRRKEEPLKIGSVKSQLGHTEGAAGIAGLLKVLLALNHKQLPGNLHFSNPNPAVDFKSIGVQVQKETEKWERVNEIPLLAGVSSFGWGGTNVHIILEEYKDDVSEQSIVRDEFVLPLSAKSESALSNYVDTYINKLKNVSDIKEAGHICSATAINKPHFNYRTAVYGKNSRELVDKLYEIKETLKNQEPDITQTGKKIAFIFPGQGSQWLGMGRALYNEESAFKNSIDKSDKAFAKYFNGSIVYELFADEKKSRLNKIEVIQPMICAVQIALAQLWESWGIDVNGVAGHSMGEVAAAYIAGCISLDEAARVICTRSKLMSKVSKQGGAMVATELSPEEALTYEKKYDGKINLAVSNSPKSTVLAGDETIIKQLITELESKELFCRQVKVDVASHSPQMDALKKDLEISLTELSPTIPCVDFYSTVRGSKLNDELVNAQYWVDNLRNSVRFSTVMNEMMKQGYSIFIEISPHPVLTMAMNDCAEASGNEIVTLHSAHREMPEKQEYINNFIKAYQYGCNIDWEKFYGINSTKFVELPGYPFQRENYELPDNSIAGFSLNDSHNGLLGKKIEIAGDTRLIFESVLDIKRFSYLNDHQVDGKAVLPASAYIDMVYAAIEARGESVLSFSVDIQFIQPIILEENKPVNVQLILESDENEYLFTIYSRIIGESDIWEIAGHGKLDRRFIKQRQRKTAFVKTGNGALPLYENLTKLGVEYGETFKNVKILEIKNNTIIALVKLNKPISGLQEYAMHPVLIDNFIQPLFASYLAKTTLDTQHIATVSSLAGLNCFEKIEAGKEYIVEYQMLVNGKSKSSKTEICGRFKAYDLSGEVALTADGVNGVIINTGESIAITENEDNMVENELDDLMKISSVKERVEKIEKIITELTAKIIKSDVNRIKSSMTFKMLGLDSIMAVQLRNQLEKRFNIKIAVSSFWKEPNILFFAKSVDVLLTTGLNVSPQQNLKLKENKWFVNNGENKKPSFRLFLFHDAGGSVMLFNEWESIVNEDVELISVQLPGRGERIDEPAYDDYQKLMDDLLPELNKKTDIPFGFLGHSMGGLLAYESARQMVVKYNKHADIVVVSATPCLRGYVNHFVQGLVATGMGEDVLAQYIPSLSKIKEGDEDFYNTFIETVRADFKLIHSYVYTPGPKLSSKIIAVCAEDDNRVSLKELDGWKKETDKEVKIISRPGGHNYIYSDKEFYSSLINTEVSQLSFISER